MSLDICDGSVTATLRPCRFHIPHLDILLHLASWEAFRRLTGSHAKLGHMTSDSVLVCLIVAGCVEIIAAHQAHLDLLVSVIVVHKVIDHVLHVHRVLVGRRTHHSNVVGAAEEF